MHSLWQEKIEFPYYPILKTDKQVDILYLEASLQNAVEAHFQKEQGKSVMIMEEKTIADMTELGGMGIIKGETKEEIKDLHRLRDYIQGRNIPCDMVVESDTCIWVHPIKLFLFMTEGIDVYEQMKVMGRKGNKLDTGTVYITADTVVEKKEKEPLYVHAFLSKEFPRIEKPYKEMRRYGACWLICTEEETAEGSDFSWII